LFADVFRLPKLNGVGDFEHKILGITADFLSRPEKGSSQP